MPAVKREAPSAPAVNLTSDVAPPTSVPKNVLSSSSTQRIVSTSEDFVSGNIHIVTNLSRNK